MASSASEPDVEFLRSTTTASGFKNVIVTASNKFQPRVYDKEKGGQRGLGSFKTAEEAAAKLAAFLRDNDGATFGRPTEARAKRGWVRCLTRSAPALCPAYGQPHVRAACFGPQASLSEEDREALEERLAIEKAQEMARKARRQQAREEKKKEREERRPKPVEQPVAPRVPSQAPTSKAQALMAGWLARGSAVAA